LKIATFNINNIQRRLPTLLAWLKKAKPDVVCLQELKAAQEAFPVAAIERAILARGDKPIVTRTELPGDPRDRQSRYIEAAVDGVLVASIYLPNGNPQPGPKFDYKLAWFDRLVRHAASLKRSKQPVILAGDYNVVPTDLDIYPSKSWDDDALLQPESRAAYKRLLKQGWTDSIRALHPDERIYTFWDYKRDRWRRNAGLRIDHILLSPSIASRLDSAGVDKEVRGWEGASDHAPAWIVLD
jgi:exodeoxyribonuclease III